MNLCCRFWRAGQWMNVFILSQSSLMSLFTVLHSFNLFFHWLPNWSIEWPTSIRICWCFWIDKCLFHPWSSWAGLRKIVKSVGMILVYLSLYWVDDDDDVMVTSKVGIFVISIWFQKCDERIKFTFKLKSVWCDELARCPLQFRQSWSDSR